MRSQSGTRGCVLRAGVVAHELCSPQDRLRFAADSKAQQARCLAMFVSAVPTIFTRVRKWRIGCIS